MTDLGGAASPRTDLRAALAAMPVMLSVGDDGEELVSRALMLELVDEAAQEAPAPEGLNLEVPTHGHTIAHSHGQQRHVHTIDAPPTPAEPPSLTRFAAMIEEMDRAEARPPKTLICLTSCGCDGRRPAGECSGFGGGCARCR